MKRSYTKHGMTGTKLHEVWKEMKRRVKGKYYGTMVYKKKGIKVCDEWQDAKPFLDWSIQNGYKEGLQLDRIDNDGDYSPENCRWVTPKENARNRATTIFYNFNGEMLTLGEISKITGIKEQTMRTRIQRGWDFKKATTKKVIK